MLIWIVDDDFYFSAQLKEGILASPVLSSDQKKIELFHRPGDFLERLKKTAKEPAKRPQLVFLDIQMPDQNGLEVYCELMRLNDPVLPAIHFCSSMSYGMVQDFFEERGIEPPPFVRKSEVAGKLDLILARFAPQEELAGKERVSLPLRKNRTAWADSLEAVRKHYYEAGLKVGDSLQALLTPLKEASLTLGFKDLVALTDEILFRMGDKKTLSQIRLRREVKDLLTLGDKMLKQLPQ